MNIFFLLRLFFIAPIYTLTFFSLYIFVYSHLTLLSYVYAKKLMNFTIKISSRSKTTSWEKGRRTTNKYVRKNFSHNKNPIIDDVEKGRGSERALCKCVRAGSCTYETSNFKLNFLKFSLLLSIPAAEVLVAHQDFAPDAHYC